MYNGSYGNGKFKRFTTELQLNVRERRARAAEARGENTLGVLKKQEEGGGRRSERPPGPWEAVWISLHGQWEAAQGDGATLGRGVTAS